MYTKTNRDKIEIVQKRAARFVQSDYNRDHSVTQMMTEMGWVSLRERRARTKATTIFKAKKGLIDIHFDFPTTLSSLRSAQNHFIHFAHTSTDIYRSSFYPSALRLWNSLPIPIRESASLPDFQLAIKCHTIIPPEETCFCRPTL